MELNKKNMVFIPVNDCNNIDSGGGSHWSLVVFFKKTSKFMYFDSAGIYNFSAAQNTIQKIAKILIPKIKDGEEVDMEIIQPPQQKNGYDCGVYVCAISQYLTLSNGDPSGLNKEISPSYITSFRNSIYNLLKEYDQ